MLNPGSIRKLTVHNFVTYEHVTLYPGPNLNLIIGPNGTGKSTIVAAVILGLGGNPKIVGRGSKISEFVKHNCNSATIIICLQNSTNNDYLKISREFNIQEKSIWKINDEHVTMKEVLNRIKVFNIQVDNLCQFLPQDRVQFFAKMNKQELLKQTQLALCRNDLLSKQQELISLRQKHNKIQFNLQQNNEKLQLCCDANNRLEGKVKNLQKKQKFIKGLENISRKEAWLSYEIYKQNLDEVEKDLKVAYAKFEELKKASKPMETNITNLKNTESVLYSRVIESSRNVKDIEKVLHKKVDEYEEFRNNISQIENDMKTKIVEVDHRQSEIGESMNMKEQLTQQHSTLTQKMNEENLEQTMNKLRMQIERMLADQRKLESKKYELVEMKLNKSNESKSLKRELERVENIKEQRLEQLGRISKDAYTAVKWLRANKHLFKGIIYEPIMLEVNILNPSKSVFLENSISLRDRLAFTCTCKEDMNTFICCVREKQHLNVNVLHSNNTRQYFEPLIPIEELRKFGMYAYVNTLFTAPEPIMNYLCKTYKLHCVPVGNAQTNHCFEHLPKQITTFFSDVYKFIVKYSHYTGEKSVNQSEIKSDKTLSISADVVQLETTRGRIMECQNLCERLDVQILDINSKIETNNTDIQRNRGGIEKIKSVEKEMKSIETKIGLIENKIRSMKMNTTTREDITEKYKKNVQKVMKIIVSHQTSIRNLFKSYSGLIFTHDSNTVRLETCQKKLNNLKNKFEETKNSVEEAQNLLRNIKGSHAQVSQKVEAFLQKAKDRSNGYSPQDEGFDTFREAFDSLPKTLEELQQEKECISARIDCLNTADSTELQDYQERLNLIQELHENIKRENEELCNLKIILQNLQKDWLEPLNNLVNTINDNFGAAFEKMGCAGEISIFTGEDDMDFESYGLNIKVTFRNGVPLQELNDVIQSGGERAVATAAFMLSLQTLTPVPFRCVDEINQGMDANNERKIFEFLVNCTSQPGTPQYFLITPKLVPNLKFADTMKIHIVHNGPLLALPEEWTRSNLCNSENVYDI